MSAGNLPFGDDFFAATSTSTTNQQNVHVDFFSTLDPFKSDSSGTHTDSSTHFDPFSTNFSNVFNSASQQQFADTDSMATATAEDNPFATGPFNVTTSDNSSKDSFANFSHKGFDADPFISTTISLSNKEIHNNNNNTSTEVDPFGAAQSFQSNLKSDPPVMEDNSNTTATSYITDPFVDTTTTTTHSNDEFIESANINFPTKEPTAEPVFGSNDPFSDFSNSDPFTSHEPVKSEFDNLDPFSDNKWPATTSNTSHADPFETDPF